MTARDIQKPIQRPIYTLICGASFEQWVSANEEDLRAWYDACCVATGDRPSVWEPPTDDFDAADFRAFCEVQYDGQMLQEEGLPLDPRELEADDDTPYEDQDPYEAIGESPFGLPGGGKSL